MGFLHLSLLAGLALASMPFLLHLMSKKQPTRIPFPAVRFVRQTMVVAERGWKVKHWLLLLLRVLMIGLLAIALAAPRVHSGMLATYLSIGLVAILATLASVAFLVAYATHRPRIVQGITLALAVGLWGGTVTWFGSALLRGESPPVTTGTGPIAAAFILDTSPSMDYRSLNKSRLEQAKEMGQWLLNRLPVESQIAIVSGEQGLRLSQDRSAAERQLGRVTLEGKAAPLARRIRAAVDLVRSSPLERREVYVLTDMNTSAWRDASSADLVKLLAEDPKVLLQLVDVGLEAQANWTLCNPQLSQQVVGPEGMVDLQVDVVSSINAAIPTPGDPAKANPPGTTNSQVAIELLREPIDVGLPVVRNGEVVVPVPKIEDRQILDVEQGASRKVRFRLRDISLGTHQFQVRLGQPDPLPMDNQLYITVEARQQGMTLIHASDPDMAEQLQGVLDPEGFVEGKPGNSKIVPGSDLASLPLNQYSAIILHDASSLTAGAVERIEEYVVNGGGVLNVLGAHFVDEKALNAAPIAKLLPGPIARMTRRPYQGVPVVFVPEQTSHPVFYPFEKMHEEGIWNGYAIYRHWDIDRLVDGSVAIMRYSVSRKPAFVEERRGQGKILTLTTPIPESSAPEGRKPWNELWATNAWPSYALLIGSMQYISGWGKHRLNYEVGQVASLENAPERDPERYELFAPDGTVVRAEPSQGSLLFPFTKVPGVYRLRGIRDNKPVVRGFSVNLIKDDLILQRIPSESLDAAMGVNQYQVAKEKEEVTSSVGQTRFGRELAPFLMLVLGVLFLCEQAMSSRFYSLKLAPTDRSARGAA